ncbi:MAG: M24 family metallopeptidase, partial [Erysipelotrichaceae bacterium]|nr:M24 family metallopeptidase [Erysipelotrichaceae bacterium]
AITDDIYQKVIQQIKIGMSEYEISALVQYYSIAAGAQQMSFDTIVATGERTALPHGRPTNKKVKAHEPIMIDFGIQYNNYQSDMTRVCFIGEPQEDIKKIYDTVLKAQLTGLAAIKAGTKARDVDKAARKVIEDAGYGEYFNHGLGHGLGVDDGSDLPILNSQSDMILQDHMMMSCEPGIYVPGVGGIRIEDDVVIMNGVGVPLNKTTKDYIILEIK